MYPPISSIALPGTWSLRYGVTTMFPPVLCSPSHPPARATSRETTLALPLPASPKLCAAWTPATTTINAQVLGGLQPHHRDRHGRNQARRERLRRIAQPRLAQDRDERESREDRERDAQITLEALREATQGGAAPYEQQHSPEE